jgi:hypothetical protein
MGYFSNGDHGDAFEAEYCRQCVHEQRIDSPESGDVEGCPVMLAHILFAYEECNSKSNAKAILDLLIEPTEDRLGKCKMFVPTAKDTRNQLPMFAPDGR